MNEPFASLADAVAAVAAGLPAEAAAAVDRARRGGAPEDGIADAAWVLRLARGRHAQRQLLRTAREPDIPPVPADRDPSRVPLLDRHAPEVATEYHAVRARAYAPVALSPGEVQLLFCLIGTVIREPSHLLVHARAALDAGVAPADLVRACARAVPFAGFGAWLEASKVLSLPELSEVTS